MRYTMKKYKIMALLTALLLMLTACNTGDVKETVDKAKNDVEKVKQTVESAKESYDKIIEMTKTLNDLKVKYIGDNSKVMKLIESTGIKDVGNFKIELQTSEAPYGLKINFDEEADKDFDYGNVEKDIVKLLGLIENLGYVEITKDGETKKYTESEISESLGFDVKDLYKDPAKLEEFIKDNYDKAN